MQSRKVNHLTTGFVLPAVQWILNIYVCVYKMPLDIIRFMNIPKVEGWSSNAMWKWAFSASLEANKITLDNFRHNKYDYYHWKFHSKYQSEEFSIECTYSLAPSLQPKNVAVASYISCFGVQKKKILMQETHGGKERESNPSRTLPKQ